MASADRGFVAFQEGMNGYARTQDTWINEDEPNTSYGGDDTRESDDDTSNSIFTDNQGQAPALTGCSVKMMPPAPFPWGR